MALGSGGGAASLRLMSFRLPCNGRKRDEGSCGARKVVATGSPYHGYAC